MSKLGIMFLSPKNLCLGIPATGKSIWSSCGVGDCRPFCTAGFRERNHGMDEYEALSALWLS